MDSWILRKVIVCELNEELSKEAGTPVSITCLEVITDVFSKLHFESIMSLRLQRHQSISSEIIISSLV